MRRLREWLNAPAKLSDREAEALMACCYLVGYFLAMAWDSYRARRELDRELRRMSDQLRIVRATGLDTNAEIRAFLAGEKGARSEDG